MGQSVMIQYYSILFTKYFSVKHWELLFDILFLYPFDIPCNYVVLVLLLWRETTFLLSGIKEYSSIILYSVSSSHKEIFPMSLAYDFN